PGVRSRATVPAAAAFARVPEDDRGERCLPVIRKEGRTGNNGAPADGLRAGDGTPRTPVLPRVGMSARPDGRDSLGVGHTVLSALYCEREPGSSPDRLLPGKENLWTMLPTLSKGWAPFPCSGSERPVLGQGRRSSTVGG